MHLLKHRGLEKNESYYMTQTQADHDLMTFLLPQCLILTALYCGAKTYTKATP